MTNYNSSIEEIAAERQARINTAIRKNFMSGNIVLSEISNIKVSGINWKQYPEFEDAFIESAVYNVIPMDEDMLQFLFEKHPEFVYKKIEEEANNSCLIL